MPLICRELVELLDTGPTSSLNRSSLSNYAFLYGVFPTAPSVAIYASQYNMELEVVRHTHARAHTFTFSHLADTLLQSDLQYRDIPPRQAG